MKRFDGALFQKSVDVLVSIVFKEDVFLLDQKCGLIFCTYISAPAFQTIGLLLISFINKQNAKKGKWQRDANSVKTPVKRDFLKAPYTSPKDAPKPE